MSCSQATSPAGIMTAAEGREQRNVALMAGGNAAKLLGLPASTGL